MKPGMKALDVGCGVGGPMRNMAKFSGCTIEGITINAMQVQRGNTYNEEWGFSKIHGICSLSRLAMILRAARMHEFPMAIFSASLGLTLGKPQGFCLVRITEVRSRAGENDEQGDERTSPWLQELIAEERGGSVRRGHLCLRRDGT
jgi:hypothetical protein